MTTISRGIQFQSFRTLFCFFGTLLFLMTVVCQPVAATGLEAPSGAIDGSGSSPRAGGAPTPNLPRNAQVMDQSAYGMGTMHWVCKFS